MENNQTNQKAETINAFLTAALANRTARVRNSQTTAGASRKALNSVRFATTK